MSYIEDGVLIPEIGDDLDEFSNTCLKEYFDNEGMSTDPADHEGCGCTECEWHLEAVERIQGAVLGGDE